jgi:hypothetical protein
MSSECLCLMNIIEARGAHGIKKMMDGVDYSYHDLAGFVKK